jgi:hypothetical protein
MAVTLDPLNPNPDPNANPTSSTTPGGMSQKTILALLIQALSGGMGTQGQQRTTTPNSTSGTG